MTDTERFDWLEETGHTLFCMKRYPEEGEESPTKEWFVMLQELACSVGADYPRHASPRDAVDWAKEAKKQLGPAT